ncbi:MAG: hypothetical protein I3274_05605 [Candidatus Moeniiplasma glomeromycotorum]|nr:hypothetical protein [Candidatus Moeniiplasma glomeromycotorum]
MVQKSFYQYDPVLKKLYLMTMEQDSFDLIDKQELPKLKEDKTNTVFQHSQATLTIEEELGYSNFLSFTLRNVNEPLPTVHNFQIEDLVKWDNLKCFYDENNNMKEGFKETVWADPKMIDYGNTELDPKTKQYKPTWERPKIFRLFWDYCPIKKPINFFFDFDLHLIDKDKDEVKPWYWYKWDYVEAESNFIFQTLSPYISNIKKEVKQNERIVWSDRPRSIKNAEREAKSFGLNWEKIKELGVEQPPTMRESRVRKGVWRNIDEYYNLPKLKEYKFKIKVLESCTNIVAIFGSNGEAVRPWKEVEYRTDSSWYHEYGNKEADHKYTSEERGNVWDFSKETTDSWINYYGNLPDLVISFTPTLVSEDNQHFAVTARKKKQVKLTGSEWMKKLWEVFVSKGVPLVLKTYEGFVFQNLYHRFTEDLFGIKGTERKVIYNSISAITKLPEVISGREQKPTNYLVFFNCPWLEGKKKTNTRNLIPWDPKCDKWNLKMRKNELIELIPNKNDLIKYNNIIIYAKPK